MEARPYSPYWTDTWRFQSRRPLHTEKGLKYLTWGFFTYIFTTLLMFLLGVAAIVYGTIEDVGALTAVFGLACGFLILALVSLILWIIGVYEMHRGKDEFGARHSEYVGRAIIMLTLYIIFIAIAFVVGFVIGLSAAMDPDTMEGAYTTATLAGLFVGVLATVVFGLIGVYLILDLVDERVRTIVWVSYMLFVVFELIGSALSIVFVTADPTGTGAGQFGLTGSSAPISGILSFIPLLMIFYCYKHALSRVENRQIKPPQQAYTTPYPAWQAYPAYSAYSAYGQTGGVVCPICGNQVSEGDKFCPNCGSALT